MSTTSQPRPARGAPALSLQQAMEEAQRCMLCHDAPCSQGCPGGTDPGRFIRQIRFLNFKGAARTVLRNNPLGGVCSYICPTEDTCRKGCLRAGLDRPIDIDGLQAYAVEYGRQLGVVALEAGDKRAERIAVVGAGPAGLVAAANLARLGYQVTIFEAKEKAGGMLRYGVPPMRLDEAKLDADIEEIVERGVELRTSTTIEGEEGAAGLLSQGYSAVFTAPGLWAPVRLPVPGMDLANVSTAVEFLADITLDPERAESLVNGVNVAIIGGGSVAMDVASCAHALGARRIYAIALESMTELPAMEDELEQARRDGVIVKPQCQVTRVLGEDGRVCGVEGVETEWIQPGLLVPDNARPIEGTSWRLKVGAVIQAVGQRPAKEAGGELIVADPATQATPTQRVFAGGDIVRGPSTVVAAVGDGKRAAEAIHRLLSGPKEVSR